MSRIYRTAVMIVLASASRAADTGRIAGPNPSLSLCQRGGTLVAWAVTDDCLSSYRTEIDVEKGFAFESLPPGSYQVTAVCESGNYYAFSPLKQIHVQARETTTAYLDVRIPPNNDGPFPLALVPLSGRVLDSAGHPIGGAIVTQRREKAHGGSSEADSAPDGRFGFCAVRPGKFTLLVTRKGYRTRAMQVDLNFHMAKPLEITLLKQ